MVLRSHLPVVTALALMISLFLWGCDDEETRFGRPSDTSAVEFSLEPASATPQTETRDGAFANYRWQTIFSIQETNRGAAMLDGADLEFFDADGTFLDRRHLGHAELRNLFGTLDLVPLGTLRSAYQFTRTIDRGFRVTIHFWVRVDGSQTPVQLTQSFQAKNTSGS